MISAVIVHYRTPRLLEAAVAALHEDARTSALPLEVIVVDNGGTSASAAGDSAPEGLEAEVLRPAENLGYAAGINLGVGHATGDVLLLMNADVTVETGCLRALLDALEGAGIAGPRLFWDQGRRLMLPPQALRTRRAELDAAWAERSPAWGRSFRRRWRRRARAFWRAETPVLCYELTGACLAVTRDGWRRVGRFDEGFRLYFEETEWLLRARRRGVRAVLAPAACCVHAYDQSAVARVGGDAVGGGVGVGVGQGRLGARATGWGVAAGEGGGCEVPAEVVAGAGSDLWVRVTDAGGRDVGGWRVRA